MNRERFEQLAQAYGGAIARWPASERDGAALLMAAEPDFARAVLAEADRLDAALDAFALTPASRALREAIVAAAPQARPRRLGIGWLLPAGLGAGLAAVLAAGIMVGAQLSEASGGAGDAAASASLADLDISGLSEEV